MTSSVTAASESALLRWGRRVLTALLVVLRLIVPVAALLAVYGASYWYQQSITIFDSFFPSSAVTPGYWLTLGHILIMLGFFVVMLTNRAFGPPYALATVVIAWLILVGAWLYVADVVATFPGSPFPPSRVLTAFVIALALAHLASIVLFDQTRGKPWWRAPFYGGLGALLLPLIYWPLAKWGTEPFLGRMAVDLAIKAALVYVLLGLYALSRPVIRPRAGLGGY
jgi:uncharacterized PurR-regulated membrane protein YhhQ (DUF165 family)